MRPVTIRDPQSSDICHEVLLASTLPSRISFPIASYKIDS